MKKLFLLLLPLGMFFTSCEDAGVDDAGITLSQESVVIAPDGGEVNIEVHSREEWSVTTTCDWCSISPTHGYPQESGTIVTLIAGMAYEDREATFVFTCNEVEKILTVSQKQKEAILADDGNTLNVPYQGGIAEISYPASETCEVTIPDEAIGWISVAPATKSSEQGTVKLIIADNDTEADRSAVVSVVAVAKSEPLAEYTISQKGGCAIKYTSSNGRVIAIPEDTEFGDANIIANTYENGVGYIKFDKPVSEIGNCAFLNCTTLTSVALPNGVTKIGDGLFQGCSSLVSVTLPDGITSIPGATFWQCHSLTSVTIPEDVTSIGNGAFNECRSLMSVVIPDGVTLIDIGAFCGCLSLTSVAIPDSVTQLGQRVFEGCASLVSVTLGNSVTAIEYSTFRACSSLESITIPDSVTEIQKYAFLKCTSMASINLPDGLTSIGEWAFGYSALESIAIPDSVTSIGSYAFTSCESLTSAVIPDSLTEIGLQMFAYCLSLTDITIPDSITQIGPFAFYSCYSLPSVTIPDGVTEIGEWAFYACYQLGSVTIPDSVTSIKPAAFGYCGSLEAFYGKFASEDNSCLIVDGVFTSAALAALPSNYTIPDGVTQIGWHAFYGCSTLQSVTIPDSVVYIGMDSFQYCSALKEVYCKAATPPRIDISPAGAWGAFNNNCDGRKIYVPTASVNAYTEAEGWSDYAADIVGYDF